MARWHAEIVFVESNPGGLLIVRPVGGTTATDETTTMDPQHPVDLEKVLSQSSSTTSADIPSNPIITETLETIRAKQAQVVPTEQLSPTGQAIMRDLSSTLSDAERLVEEKNRDDLIQRMTQHAAEIARLQNSEVGRNALKKMLEESTQPAGWMWQSLKDEDVSEKLGRLVKSLVTSPQLRQFVFDVTGFLQSLLGQIAAETGGEKTAASGETPTEIAEQTAESAVERVREMATTTASRPAELEEQKRRLGDRFIELMQTAQKHPEFQEVFDAMARQVRNLNVYRQQGGSVWEERYATLEPAEQKALSGIKESGEEMVQCAKKLLENLGNTTLDDVGETWRDVYRQINNDQEAIDTLQSVTDWLAKCLRDENYLAQGREPIGRDAEENFERLRSTVLEKYRPAVEHLLSQLRYHLDRMRRDPLARQLSGDLSALTRHLFYDEQGRPTLKPELLGDLQTIVPAILRSLRYIKLPDIQIHDPGLDFVASNIVINVGELAPHHLRLVVMADRPEEGKEEPARTMVEFEVSRIHAEARNIHFAINKTGIPPLLDTGLADFRMFEEGMGLKLRLQPILGTSTVAAPPGQRTLTTGLQVTHCVCRLEHFELNVHGSGHDWMYYLLGPYIRRLVREKIERAVEAYFMSTDLMASFVVPETVVGTTASQQPAHLSSSQGVPLSSSQPVQ